MPAPRAMSKRTKPVFSMDSLLKEVVHSIQRTFQHELQSHLESDRGIQNDAENEVGRRPTRSTGYQGSYRPNYSGNATQATSDDDNGNSKFDMSRLSLNLNPIYKDSPNSNPRANE
jgi:hypothetical protein